MPQPKRLSQAAIAKSLGISRATVSLVLRGGQGAAEETKKRVLEAASEMGYRPNALIHSIRSGKSRTVGVLAQPHDSYCREVCYGIHDPLIDSEHLPLFLWTNDHLDSEASWEEYSLKQIHRLLDRWVDGVIFWPNFAELYKQHLTEFESRNIPLVAIHHVLLDVPVDIVESDENQIADLIVNHLAGLGHRHYLVVSGPKGIYWADSRADAVTARLEKIAGASVQRVHVHPSARHVPAGIAAITAALKAHPKTTAVIACTDKFAQLAYAAANALELEISRRLSVMGVADLDFAAVMSPPLTTVRQDGYAIGQRAAQVELERSAGLLIGPPRRFREPVKLVVRGSTGPAS
ncbi:MAG TPA: LacI family DNA-binding transcriptional regulator [Lacunisphaera sp.]|nr:LacI family DNA-binding transcriptional regulator [Lacunisphaera sp.]